MKKRYKFKTDYVADKIKPRPGSANVPVTLLYREGQEVWGTPTAEAIEVKHESVTYLVSPDVLQVITLPIDPEKATKPKTNWNLRGIIAIMITLMLAGYVMYKAHQ